MRAVVTGGTGFIGSWLISELLGKGYEVIAPVRSKNKLTNEISKNGGCTIIEKSLDGIRATDFPGHGYDVFFHMAWSGVAPEKKNDEGMQMGNIMMGLHAIQVAADIGCKLFISAGTVAEYALCDGVMDYARKQEPGDMYGAAKASAHYFFEVKARQLGIPFIWCVIPSTFGERRTDNNIITYTIKTLLQGRKPQYGTLRQMWDFLYVADVARAMRLAGEMGKAGKIYGIGSGIYRPLREYICIIRDMVAPHLELGIGETTALGGRASSSCVNIYELVKDTGFSPCYPFEEGIRRTVQWMKEGGI